MPEKAVVTLCVNYHNEEETCSFVASMLAQHGDIPQHIVVVDNTAAPDHHGLLSEISDERVLVLRSGHNLGYLRGAAWGLSEYRKRFGQSHWVIVCNTDITINDPFFLSKLVSLYSGDSAAVIAPSVVSNVSRQDSNPFMRFRPSRARMHFYQFMFRHYPISSAYHAAALLKARLSKVYLDALPWSGRAGNSTNRNVITNFQPERIYAPHGAFMIFSRTYFELGGTLEHGAFLCGEEMFVAETARRLQLPVIYDPRLAVLHLEHASLQRYTSRVLLSFLSDATDYITRTFFSASGCVPYGTGKY